MLDVLNFNAVRCLADVTPLGWLGLGDINVGHLSTEVVAGLSSHTSGVQKGARSSGVRCDGMRGNRSQGKYKDAELEEWKGTRGRHCPKA